MRGAIIPTVPGKTLHLSIICGFLLGAITGWLTTITTHLSGRKSRCLEKNTFLSHTSHLFHVTKRRSVLCQGNREVLYPLCCRVIGEESQHVVA